jgi:hypothetical protein
VAVAAGVEVGRAVAVAGGTSLSVGAPVSVAVAVGLWPGVVVAHAVSTERVPSSPATGSAGGRQALTESSKAAAAILMIHRD